MTSTEPEIARLGQRPALDGFRGAAVLLVLAGHFLGDAVPRAGSTGVSLFFVLSGFLITVLLVEEHRDAGRVRFAHFYLRRALRLFPVMVVVLAVVGAYAAITDELTAPVAYPALYVANVAMAAGRDLGALAHTWSLSMEEQFYLVWPILLLVALRRSPRVATALAAAGIVVSWLTIPLILLTETEPGTSFDRVAFGPDTRAYALFLGCLLGLLMPSLWRYATAARRLAWVGVPVIALVCAAPTIGTGPYYALQLPLATLAGTAILVHLLE